MINPASLSRCIADISAILGDDRVTTNTEDRHCYSYDGSNVTHLPDAIVFPQSTEQVSRVMERASHHRIPVVPRGAGSGMTGGIVPVAGGIVMAMAGMNKIIEIDADNQIGIVEPGVVTGDLQKAVGRLGLMYPPDPASLSYCTIGGNAAECAGGPSAVKYGVTKDYIIGLEVVLPSGSIINAGARTEKSVVGYDLTRLFICSEGTLGIITKLIVRLLPLPPHKETFLLSSSSLARTTGLVARILNAGISPCTLEYMDKTAIRIVADMMSSPPPSTTQAMLIVEIDGEKSVVRERVARLRELLAQEDGFAVTHAVNREEIDHLWQARRAISPACFKLKPHKISEDVAVPRSRIPELVAEIETLSAELDLIMLSFGHAGDGNIHVNIMLDRDDPDEMQRAAVAKKKVFEKAIGLGGTLSGEHGIGLSKAPYLAMEVNAETMAVMKQIKKLFDPHNILNPGKIFPQ